MWLSVVIPVYNAEKYLRRCVDSLLKAANKTNQKIEILLIDNHSTDSSAKIAADLARRHPSIIQLHSCDTPGASAVRNLGARLARGDYLWFVDADDYVAPSALSALAVKCQNRPAADLVMLGAQKEPGAYLSAVLPSEPNFRHRFVRYGMGPWQVVIRRAWWRQHQFAFREGIIHEDMELMSALILAAKHYDAIDQPLYIYCQNPESVLHKSTFSPHIFDIFPALTGLYTRFETEHQVTAYRADLEWFFTWNLLLDSAADFVKFGRKSRSGFKKSRQLLRQYFPHWRRNEYLRQKPLRLRLRVRLNFWGITHAPKSH